MFDMIDDFPKIIQAKEGRDARLLYTLTTAKASPVSAIYSTPPGSGPIFHCWITAHLAIKRASSGTMPRPPDPVGRRLSGNGPDQASRSHRRGTPGTRSGWTRGRFHANLRPAPGERGDGNGWRSLFFYSMCLDFFFRPMFLQSFY